MQNRAGYISHTDRTVTYDARAAGIDGDRYATECTRHGSLVTTRTIRQAETAAASPWDWCEWCTVSAPSAIPQTDI